MAFRKESLLFVFVFAACCVLTNAGNGDSAGIEISRLFVTKGACKLCQNLQMRYNFEVYPTGVSWLSVPALDVLGSSLPFIISVLLVESHEVSELKQPNGTGCGCVEYTCGCCAHLEVAKIGLNNTVCTNLTYLPNLYGISLTLSLDGVVYYNKTISARNPPPMCAGVPYLKKEASLCIKFYNLSIQQHTFSGCVDVLARLATIEIEKFQLGCFKIPPSGSPALAMSGTRNIQDGQQYRFDVAETKRLLKQKFGSLGTGCSCLYYDCGCCVHMELDTFGLNNTVCGNLTFEPKQSIVDISLSVDKKVYVNESVSVRNPPPVCAPLLSVKDVSLCLQLYNLDIKDAKLTGCLRVITKVEDRVVENYDVGCFKFPLVTTGAKVPASIPAE